MTEKSGPTTSHGGAWGQRTYSSYSFITSVLQGSEWSALQPGRALPRLTNPRYSHSVCMYSSPNSFFNVGSLQNIQTNTKQQHHMSTYQHCLSTVICSLPQTNCFFCGCSECTGLNNLENTSEDVVTDNAIENISFKQWILTDRHEVVTTLRSTEEFTAWKTVTFSLSFSHCNTASYVPQRTECNLQSGESVKLHSKLFFCFARWSIRVSVEQSTSHHPSTCN
jgi:hypothetical protein